MEAVSAKAQAFTSVELTASESSSSLSSYYIDAIQNDLSKASKVKSYLQERELFYTDFVTDLEITDFAINSEIATITATEFTTYTISGPNGEVRGPGMTAGVDYHTMTFEKINNRWYLVKDVLSNLPSSSPPQEGLDPVLENPLTIDPNNYTFLYLPFNVGNSSDDSFGRLASCRRELSNHAIVLRAGLNRTTFSTSHLLGR